MDCKCQIHSNSGIAINMKRFTKEEMPDNVKKKPCEIK